jgi:hypothetical protein
MRLGLTAIFLTLAACSGDNVAPGGGVTGTSSGNPGPPGSSGGQDQDAGAPPDGGSVASTDFDVTVADATLVEPRPGEIPVKIVRKSYLGAIKVTLSDLPASVGASATTLEIAAGQTDGKFSITAGADVGHGTKAVKFDAKSGDGKIAKSGTFNLFVRGVPGAVDKTFGTGGQLTTVDFALPGNLGLTMNQIEVDSMDRVWVAFGNADARGSLLARFLPSGAIDTTFNNVGHAYMNNGIYPETFSVAPDGSFYVFGRRNAPGRPDIHRYSATVVRDYGFNVTTEYNDVVSLRSDMPSWETLFMYSISAGSAGVRARYQRHTSAYRFGLITSPETTRAETQMHTLTGAPVSQTFINAPSQLLTAAVDSTDRVYLGGLTAGVFKLARYTSAGLADGVYQDTNYWSGVWGQRAGTVGGRVLFGIREGIGEVVLALKDDMTAFPGYPRLATGARGVALDASNQVLVVSTLDSSPTIKRYTASGAVDSEFTAAATAACASATLPLVAVQRLDNKPIVSCSTGSAFVLKRLWN